MFHFLTVIQLSPLSSPTCHPSHGRYCLWLVLATNEPIAATSCDYWPPSLSRPIKLRIAETGCFKDSSWTIKEPHPYYWMHSVVGLCPGLCSLVSLLHFGPLWPSPETILLSDLPDIFSWSEVAAHVNSHFANQFLPSRGRQGGECKFIVEEDIFIAVPLEPLRPTTQQSSLAMSRAIMSHFVASWFNNAN